MALPINRVQDRALQGRAARAMASVMKQRMRRTKAATPGSRREIELVIERLGGGGDGVGTAEDHRIYVPYAAPGDRVRARLGRPDGQVWRGEFIEMVEAGPNHRDPPCPHFGPCGGCQVQHLAAPVYTEWKRGLLVNALSRQGIEGEVGALVETPARSRRRASLAARRGGSGVFLGFNEAGSSRIIDLTDCVVLRPEITALLPPLRAVLAGILPQNGGADLTVTLLEDGIDLVVVADNKLDLAMRERLAEFAVAQDLARLSWRGADEFNDPVAHRRSGVIRFDGIPVTIPPGGFLQASAEGEAALTGLVRDGVGAARKIADLFCGAGTFALPLAGGAHVTAIDGEAAAIDALATAARRGGRGERVAAQRRDLFRQPLTAVELKGFDAVVFDPPRAGARDQAEALAASAVPLVVAVSCNPSSLARDARILVDGGYRLERATPVDQFLWSTHLEAVAVFRK
jgi:23S rRNA (uracil1939-C5)-methyltransferase